MKKKKPKKTAERIFGRKENEFYTLEVEDHPPVVIISDYVDGWEVGTIIINKKELRSAIKWLQSAQEYLNA